MDENCPHTGVVNFGEGPVKVRCTKVGPHDNHICEVLLDPDPDVVHKNVFEGDDVRPTRN